MDNVGRILLTPVLSNYLITKAAVRIITFKRNISF